MIGLRDPWMKRLAASLGGLAIYLQLALAASGMMALAAPGGATDAFAEHALCLAGGGAAQPTAPSDGAPVAPTHDHVAFCCLWHPLPGVAPQAAQAPLPVTYAAIAHHETGETAFIPGPRRGPANARAPPTLA
jgi:hypothetical protein